MEIDIAINDSPLVIAFYNNLGILQPIQELDQYLYGSPDLRILCYQYGRRLFDILYDDHGLISYHDNKIALSTILQIDMNSTVMSIMGKVGESVIVRECARNYGVNQMWMRLASFKQVRRESAEKFRAVGTGFKSTKRNYPNVYNPQDTQRDIIWIDNEGYRYQMNGSNSSRGIDAGLQVKVSTNGMQYIFDDLLNNVYEVPVVYFDLKDDYWKVYHNLQKELQGRGADYRNLQNWFIPAREIDENAFDEVLHYASLIRAMVDGRLSPELLVDRAEQYKSFGTAVMAGALESIASNVFIEASDD